MPLNLPRLETPRAFFTNPMTGRPMSGGQLRFYAPGTTTPKAVYADREGVNPVGNQIALDAAGSCQVFLSGSYRVEVYAAPADSQPTFTADFVNSIPVELEDGNPGSLLASENLADLADIPTARAVLGLQRQENRLDATLGRVMLNGGLGIGGDAVSPPGDVTDFNALVAPGNYWIETPSALENRPATVSGILSVDPRNAFRVIQEYKTTSASSGGRIYSRAQIAGGWTRWVMTFTQSNIVGEVTQASNVPTGAVIETGAVSGRGRYTKWADGTLIQWRRGASLAATTAVGNMFRSASETWEYPVPFVGALPSIGMIAERTVTAVAAPWATLFPQDNPVSLTAAVGMIYGPTNTSQGLIHWTATGRWF